MGGLKSVTTPNMCVVSGVNLDPLMGRALYGNPINARSI
jgi:hypothetical protein